MTGITLLGLGPGNPKYLTCEAKAWLENVSEVYVIDKSYPVIKEMVSPTRLIYLDVASDDGVDDTARCDKMVDQLIELGSRSDGVTLAVTGHPGLDFPYAQKINDRAKEKGIPVHVIPGLSLSDLVIQSIGLPAQTNITMVDGNQLAKRHVPGFPPSLPAVISPLESRERAARIQMVLRSTYPDEHPVILVHITLKKDLCLEQLKLGELTESKHLSEFTSLYISPMGLNTAFETFQEVVARLRAPDGCPWDREQTHTSLRQHLLEESYETLEAIDSGSMEDLCEELGDLLLQIVLNAQIASEAHHFTMSDVVEGINTKIINRHPHVFGEFQVDGVGGVLKNWEKLKEAERQQNGNATKGLLDGAPASLPALAYAHEIQDRAARVGFDWPGIEGVIAKVHEELGEVLSADTEYEREKEIGDLAFAVVNLARWLKVDPESALRGTNMKFKKRFAHIETTAREKGISLGDLGFEEMDRLWEEAKDRE
jgi:tetrapyrrole methylase family protein/MazG family protein